MEKNAKKEEPERKEDNCQDYYASHKQKRGITSLLPVNINLQFKLQIYLSHH
jgi:hypothetical protein